MIILLLFVLAPFLLGLLGEYLVCRLTMKFHRAWKSLPPLVAVGITAVVGVGRFQLWSSTEASPITTLIFVPGLPALFGFLGLLLGWLLWRKLWRPKVVRYK